MPQMVERMKKNRKCKHFNGVQSKTCLVGIAYDTFKGLKLPCLLDEGSPICGKCEPQTDADIEAKAKMIEERFQRTVIARAVIVDHLGGPWKKGAAGSQGVIDCPVCKGVKTLKFSRAGVNGHIHAACKTDGCVAWME